MRIARIIILLLLLANLQNVFAQKSVDQKSVTDTSSVLTAEELHLLGMLNDFRVRSGLTSIPHSPSLSKVAAIHAADLIFYKPAEKGCTLQSWSDSGNWRPCCALKDKAGMECMKSKPKELTSYGGDGYELVYWTDEQAVADDAASMWLRTTASQDMILNRGKWAKLKWKACGVAIREGYVLLWLGDKPDVPKIARKQAVSGKQAQKPLEIKELPKSPSKEALTHADSLKNVQKLQKARADSLNAIIAKEKAARIKQKADSLKSVQKSKVPAVGKNKADSIKNAAAKKASPATKPITDSTKASTQIKSKAEVAVSQKDTVYYLVIASVGSKSQALAEVKKLKSNGYSGASVVADVAVYRVAVLHTFDRNVARTRHKDLKSKFPGIWIWKKLE